MHIKNIYRAFTLVELIVVITIIGILSTVGFVSYSGYLTGARDSNRISQMVKISDSLQVHAATKNLPLPDNYLAITQEGAITAYQGVAGVNVLETIDYTNGGKDPKDDTFYSYTVSRDRKKIQLLAFMEDQTVVNFGANFATYAEDYSGRFPSVYGKKLGVVLRASDNMPIDQISGGGWNADLDTINEVMKVYFTNNIVVTGTGAKINRAKMYHAADFTKPYIGKNISDIGVDVCPNNRGKYMVIDLSGNSSYVLPGQYITSSEFSGRVFMYCYPEAPFYQGGSYYFISEYGDVYSINMADVD